MYKKLKCSCVFSGVLSCRIFVRELPSGMYSRGFQCTLKSITLEVRLVYDSLRSFRPQVGSLWLLSPLSNLFKNNA